MAGMIKAEEKTDADTGVPRAFAGFFLVSET
jgi:hypothetical protein